MIARAPGKIVLSGAYAVLEGAPAIVAAVSRYVLADSARPAPMVTDEVQRAIDAGVFDRAPFFDASALRAGLPDGTSRKLGLGSSAAVLVASLGARIADRAPRGDDALRLQVLAPALAAHRAAQAGGSGIDVAASVHGGVLACRLGEGGALAVAPHALPSGTIVEVFASPTAASTRDLLGRVRAFAARDPLAYAALIGDAGDAARAAIDALRCNDLVASLRAQTGALGQLGALAEAPIVTPEVAALFELAAREGAAFGPSGAGGGDVAIFVGSAPSSSAFRERAGAASLTRLDLTVGARGLHLTRG